MVSDFQDAVMARAVATAALDAAKDEHAATVNKEERPKIELAVARVLKAALALERENGKLQQIVNRAETRGAFGTSAWSARPTLTLAPVTGSNPGCTSGSGTCSPNGG